MILFQNLNVFIRMRKKIAKLCIVFILTNSKSLLVCFTILLNGTSCFGIISFFGFLMIGISKMPSNSAPLTSSGLQPSERSAAFLTALSTTLFFFLVLLFVAIYVTFQPSIVHFFEILVELYIPFPQVFLNCARLFSLFYQFE